MRVVGEKLRRGSGRNLLFPRNAVPRDVGKSVRNARKARKMSQARLAGKVGVTRWAIMRLEAGTHVPNSQLVHSLERILKLGDRGLVSAWTDPAPHGSPARGPRARLARIRLGFTLSAISAASGVSLATISRFERECGDTPLILGPAVDRGDGFANDKYAQAHCFLDALEMETFAFSTDLAGWLALLISRRDCALKLDGTLAAPPLHALGPAWPDELVLS